MKARHPSSAARKNNLPLLAGAPVQFLPHLSAALKECWRDHQRKLKRCQREFSEKAVHQTRVATRRLLSLIELHGRLLHGKSWKKARRALKDYLDIFDVLRDAHVQLQAVEAMINQFPELAGFKAALMQEEKRAAKKAGKKVRNTKTRKLDRWITELKIELRRGQETVPPRKLASMAMAGLDSGFRRVVELQQRIDPADSATIHRTRIAFKQFRYMIEALAPLLPGVTELELKAMQHYQSVFGELQDAEVLLSSAERFLRKHKAGPQTIEKVHTELSRRRRDAIEHCMRIADQLSLFWPLPKPK
jgi:CHAD domain-containing protein